MITKHQLVGAIGVALATGVLQLAAAEQAAAQRPKGTATKPTTLAPAAPPSPSNAVIIRIEAQRSVVTARETATGFTFRFSVKTRRLLGTLKIGQPVWADFATKTVKLKISDVEPCCNIVETPPPPALGALGAPQELR